MSTAPARDGGWAIGEADHAHVGGQRHADPPAHLGHRRRCRASGPPGIRAPRPGPFPPRSRSARSTPRWGQAAAASSGKAWRSACIAAISASGGKTPPLTFSAVKPYCATIRCACATRPSGSSAAPQASVLAGRMPGPLVEQVATEGDLAAHRSPEQVADRSAQQLPLNIQAGHIERAQHPVGGRGSGHHSAHPVTADTGIGRQGSSHQGANPVDAEHIATHQRSGRQPQPVEMRCITVGLPQAEDPTVGRDLDDRPQARTVRARRPH